jgi:hypothetical protein
LDCKLCFVVAQALLGQPQDSICVLQLIDSQEPVAKEVKGILTQWLLELKQDTA